METAAATVKADIRAKTPRRSASHDADYLGAEIRCGW
jgi:hypothetical protein